MVNKGLITCTPLKYIRGVPLIPSRFQDKIERLVGTRVRLNIWEKIEAEVWSLD
jgi:hypothetical protein